MRLTRSVVSPRTVEDVFAYLSDFTTTTDWDPGSILTTRISGDGGIGTKYANRSRFNGRETELEYTVIDFVPNARVQLRGENKTVTAVDTITVEATPDGTRVTYDALFTFRGIAAIAAPFLKGAFKRLGDEAEAGLRTALQAK